MRVIENICLLLGRLLMGSYFILPGLRKISNYQGTTDAMLAHSVPDQRAKPARERDEVHNQMATAGGKDTRNFAGNKGINV